MHDLKEKLLKEHYCFRDTSAGGYHHELRFDIFSFMLDTLQIKENFTWYDLCCGEFLAGLYYFHQAKDRSLENKIKIIGVDLIPPSIEEVRRALKFEEANVVNYQIPEKADLITCVRGLIYVERYFGNQEKLILNWYNSLKEGGVLVFNTHGKELQEKLKEQLDNVAIFDQGSLGFRAVIRK